MLTSGTLYHWERSSDASSTWGCFCLAIFLSTQILYWDHLWKECSCTENSGMTSAYNIGIVFPSIPSNHIPGYNHHLQEKHRIPLIQSGKHLAQPPSLMSQLLPLSFPSQQPPPTKPITLPSCKNCSSASSPKCNIHLPSSFPFYNCILPLSYCSPPPHSFSFSHYSHFLFSPLILPTCKGYLSFFTHHFTLSPSKAASSSWKHSLPILPPSCKILPDFTFFFKKKKKSYIKINYILFWKSLWPLNHHTQQWVFTAHHKASCSPIIVD